MANMINQVFRWSWKFGGSILNRHFTDKAYSLASGATISRGLLEFITPSFPPRPSAPIALRLNAKDAEERGGEKSRDEP